MNRKVYVSFLLSLTTTTVLSQRECTAVYYHKQSCIRGNDTKVCSGRGECRCGECECHKSTNPEDVVSGKYCECDNFNCPRYDGKLCSGPNHGTCICGVCQCNDDWTDDYCECRKSNINCIDPKTKKICNDRGTCTCGMCECKSHTIRNKQYSGKYCEECPMCLSPCKKYKECVQCQVFQSGALDNDQCVKHCPYTVIASSHFDVSDGEYSCVFIDEDKCEFQFKYRNEDNDLLYIVANIIKNCSRPFDSLNIYNAGSGYSGIDNFIVIFIVLNALMPQISLL